MKSFNKRKLGKLLVVLISLLFVFAVAIFFINKNKENKIENNNVEITYKAESPFGESAGTTIPASCESGIWQENGGDHLDGTNAYPGYCPGQPCKAGPNVCGMVNSGKIVAGGSCSVVAPADSLCPPPTLNVNLNPTTIPDKGTYSLKYDSLNTKNCSVTFPTGETIATYPVAYDFGNVSGERGPVTRDWTVSCLGTNGAIVKKTVTLKIQGPCETVSCPVPKDPCEVNPSSCAPTHKYVCSDGVDNDNDGKVDAADPGCSPYGVYLPKYNTEINKNILCLDVSGNPIVCPVPVDPVCVSGDSRPSCPQEPSTVTDGSSQAKIISFTANPKLILYDKSSKISWKVEGLTGSKKCNITYYTDSSESQADFGTVAASNAESNKVTDLLRKKTTYVLTCGNEIRETTVSVYSLYES